MRLLVVGHRGMLGRDLMKVLPGSFETSGADCDELDIRKIASVRSCLGLHKPEVVINAAAYTDVDGAEKNETLAFDVNAVGAGNVAAAARELGARIVHLSTDYVFDGTKNGAYVENDEPNPINAYGRSKLAGERAVQGAHPEALIVRTEWLYGRGGKNFVETILRLASERDKLSVVNDQHGAPTWTAHLARGINALVDKNAKGIVHVTNSGATTWFDFAKRILELAQVKNVAVAPCNSEEFGRPAQRPANSVLDGSKFARITGAPLPSWEEAIGMYMKERSENA